LTDITLHLARHGESTWNAAGRIQGQQDAPLSKRGEEQAVQLADRLADLPIRTIVASDLTRARMTAEPIAQICGLPVALEPNLRERHFGIAEARLYVDLEAEFEGERPWWTDTDFAFEGGESIRDHYLRVAAYLRSFLADPPPGDILLVSHGGTIRVARAFLSGRGADEVDRDAVGNGAVTTIAFDNGALQLPDFA
jgi:broad specificity phosphatase PhoE